MTTNYKLLYLLGKIKKITLQETKDIITEEKALEEIKKEIWKYDKLEKEGR